MFDRVKQVTTTTGTGDYAISGAAPPTYRTFAEAATDYNAKFAASEFACCYLAIFGTDWEVGYGVCSSSGTLLSRSAVINGSNGNSPVDWGAGEKSLELVPLTFSTTGFGARHQYDGGTSYPNADDDMTQGFGYGSTWLNASGKLWLCTNPDTGAAVWTRIGPGIVVPNGAPWFGNPEDTVFGGSILNTDGSDDPAPRADLSLMLAFVSSSNPRHARGGPVAGRIQTTDATAGLGVSLAGSTSGAFVGKGLVLAYINSTGKTRSWEVSFTAKVVAGVCSLLGTPVITDLDADTELATADVDIVIASSNVLVNTIGIAATTITWAVSLTLAEIYAPS